MLKELRVETEKNLPSMRALEKGRFSELKVVHFTAERNGDLPVLSRERFPELSEVYVDILHMTCRGMSKKVKSRFLGNLDDWVEYEDERQNYMYSYDWS